MSIAQMIFNKGNYIENIELDAIISESATAVAEVTENPVEYGADINDHMIIKPMSFTVSGVVSNVNSKNISFPTDFPASFSKTTNKSQITWEALLKLQINRTPFTLVQGLKRYSNVVIISLSETQDVDTANGLFFTATLKEIIKAGAQLVTKDQFKDQKIADMALPSIHGGLKQITKG